VNLLIAATELGCRRIVLTGSLTEPDFTRDDRGIPASPYAAAKWASSVYGRMFHKLYGTPVVIARPSMTYGPAQDSRKLVPYVIESLLRGEAPKLTSGRQELDWVYVEDVAEGLIAAGWASGGEGSTIDLGSGAVHSLRAVVEKIAGRIGAPVEPVFGALPDRPLEKALVADTLPAKVKLGWEARTSLESGLDATIEWHREKFVSDGRRAAVGRGSPMIGSASVPRNSP
jgi:nucleoside-diphosphate-sugar epimerase